MGRDETPIKTKKLKLKFEKRPMKCEPHGRSNQGNQPHEFAIPDLRFTIYGRRVRPMAAGHANGPVRAKAAVNRTQSELFTRAGQVLAHGHRGAARPGPIFITGWGGDDKIDFAKPFLRVIVTSTVSEQIGTNRSEADS
ncbi:MAG: hypothetical protein P4N60_07275 [Verrucomicrobiae bacterium]|nr:hypothetical protein [Verrucomicrobiae bacterium]